MEKHVIQVSLQKEKIGVEPAELTMSVHDEVRWEVRDKGRLSIEFDGKSPFAGKTLAHDKATQGNRPRDEARGSFKYSVVDEANPNKRLDPAIIIKDPPTG